MTAIDQSCLPAGLPAAALWAAVTARAQAWWAERQVSPRDAVVLLPFAALLPPARAAFAALGGWQPRVETVLTLKSSLGPPAVLQPCMCTGDGVLDRLSARAMLQPQPWAQRWLREDPAGFETLVARTVDAAQALRARALALHPRQREAFWADAEERLRAGSPVAAAEGSLLQLALAWARGAADPSIDRLHQYQPAAWVLLRIGGADAEAEALAAGSGMPALCITADRPVEQPFEPPAASATVRRWLCEDMEAEAQAAARDVLGALQAGRAPVGLVALDRELARRVLALLQRLQVPLVDETGWVLATTPAAASLMALLRAASRQAGRDARLAWLKGWPGAEAAAVDALEAHWRGRRHIPALASGLALEAALPAWLAPFSEPNLLPLAQWLQRVADHWLAGREGDAAAQQVAAALHLPGAAATAPAWAAVGQTPLSLSGFTAWVQGTLELAPYLPLPDAGAQVVVTPLARAYGRGFQHVVVPAADATHLGGAEPNPGLIADAAAAELGLPHAAERRQRQVLALAQVLRSPSVTLIRRHREGDEPLADSPLVEWWLLALAQAGQAVPAAQLWQPPLRPLTRAPVARPTPAAAQRLPARLSATQLDALRACPYRFFSRAVLRLDEADELDTDLEKRDYGEWLHAVLYEFHRGGGQSLSELTTAAEQVTRDQSLDEADLLPWRASFENLAPAYVAWWTERRALGWQWLAGESDRQRVVQAVPGLLLHGRIDRLDQGPAGQQHLLDYKTGSVASLKKKLEFPLEDTQLAFYAALVQADQAACAVTASYLALDDAQAPTELAHPAVHQTAARLLDGLAQDWHRLRQGATLQALGEGAVCETCEARGLCRRDHWGAA